MINFVDIMNLYLDKKNIENREKYKDYKGWFSASSAGQCHKKQYYKLNQYEEEPFNRKTKRLLDLGTIVHKGFEEALNWYNDNYLRENEGFVNSNDSVFIKTEERVEIPELNVVGHLDAAYINLDTKNVTLFDLKTIGDWPWKMKFGRKPKPSNSNRYYMQTGTYVLGLKKIYPDFDYNMVIVWYNKNNSMMKEQNIYPDWEHEAKMYWEDLKDSVQLVDSEDSPSEIVEIPPHSAVNIPVETWECNYCNFSKQCKIDTK